MNNKEILLGHGSGGKLSNNLINDTFLKYFKNSYLNQLNDSAILDIGADKIAFTTDSYVINPIFFPGGDIGKLAVCGTINDLAVSGAKPLFLSAAFIIEEGFILSDLEKIVISMAKTAGDLGIKIVTGDTKVVAKGECDKIFINTTGIGIIENDYLNNINRINEGDKIIINGFLGDHGMSVMSARNYIDVASDIKSDCAPLYNLIDNIFETGSEVKFIRDITRGGLATVLNEVYKKYDVGISILENVIPVRESVVGLCEMLGFDPIYVANEGKIVLIVGENDAEKVVNVMKKNKYGENAQIIGEITNEKGVILETRIGGRRIIDMLSGMQLPRIC